MAPIAVSSESPLVTSETRPKALSQDMRLAILDQITKNDRLPPLTALLETKLEENGWYDRVRDLALELLRSGECRTYDEVMAEVVRRVGGGSWGKEDPKKKKITGERFDEIDVKVDEKIVKNAVHYVKACLWDEVEVMNEDGKKGKSHGADKRNGA